MKKKKGQLEVSFNWIFVLIAGAAILFFFIRLIGGQTTGSEDQLSHRVMSRLDTIFTIVEQNPGVEREHGRLQIELEFKCNVEGHHYSSRGGSSNKHIDTRLLFSPKIVGGSELLTWTKTINAGFPVSPALYLTDTKTKYLFINDEEGFDGGGRVKRLYNGFPDIFQKKLINHSDYIDYEDKGFRQYIIILNRAHHKTFKNDNINRKSVFVGISQDEIHFLKNPEQSWFEEEENSSFFSQELLYGAIITGEKELYECVLEKTLTKLRMTTKSNSFRAQMIQEDPSISMSCRNAYGSTENILGDLLGNAETKEFNKQNMTKIRENINSLRAENNRLTRADCPLIY